jgi:hypothetical protein
MPNGLGTYMIENPLQVTFSNLAQALLYGKTRNNHALPFHL